MSRSGARIRRGARIAGFLVLMPLALAVVLLAALALPPVRVAVAHYALTRFRATLGGVVSVREILWPSPGHLRAAGVVWTGGGDTLLMLRSVEAKIDLAGLLRRDLHVYHFSLTGLGADLPAVRRLLQPNGGSPGRSSFPRQGSFAPVPSVAIDSFSIAIESLRLTDSLIVDEAAFGGAFDNRRDSHPRLTLSEFRIRACAPSVDSEGIVEIDVAQGIYRGNATVEAPPWRLMVDLYATADDSISVALLHGAEDAKPWGLWARCALTRQGHICEGLGFLGHAWLPGSDDIILLTAPDETPSLPRFPRTRLALDGFVRWKGGLESRLTLDALPNDVVRHAAARLVIHGSNVRLDTMALGLPGVRFDAAATVIDSAIQGRCCLNLTDGAEVAAWLGSPVLRGLRTATLFVEGAGPVAAPAVTGGLVVAGMLGDMPVDSIRFDLATPAALVEPAAVRLRGSVGGHGLYTQGSVEVDARMVRLVLNPISFSLTGPQPSAVRQGFMTADTRDGSIRISDILVASDWGMLLCAGDLGPATDNVVMARVDWPGMPTALEAWPLLHGERSRLIAAAWRDGGPFFISVRADIAPAPSACHTVRGRVRLPGPAQFAALVPEAELADLEPVEGIFTVRVDPSARLDAQARFTAKGWMDSAIVHIQTTGDTVRLDSLDLGLRLGRLTVSGIATGPQPALRLHCEVTDLGVIRSVVPSLPADLGGRLRAEVRHEGRGAARAMVARTEASVAAAGVQMPQAEVDVSWRTDSLAVDLRAPSGLNGSGFEIGRLVAHYAGGAGGVPGTLTVAAETESSAAWSRIGIARDAETWRITVDSLDVRLPEGVATTSQPFLVTYDLGRTTLTVHNLFLGGTFGTLHADGLLSPEGSSFLARLATVVPAHSITMIPPSLRGATLNAALRCTGRDSLEATWQIDGLAMPVAAVRGEIRAGREGMSLGMTARQSGRDVVTGRVVTPLRLIVWPPGLLWSDVALDGLVRVESLLVPGTGPKADPGLEAVVQGSLALGGTIGAPRGELRGAVEMPRRKNQPSRSLQLLGELAPFARVSGAPRSTAGHLEGSLSSVDGTLLAIAGWDTILTASAHTTVVLSQPFLVTLPDSAPIEVSLDAPRFPLEILRAYLPARTEVAGMLDAHLHARGAAATPALGGVVRVRDARIRLADGSRAASHIDLTLGGTLRAPRVRGSISVLNGVVVLPERPRAVHDAEGEALLWETPPPGYGQVGQEIPREGGPRAPPLPPAVIADVDVALRVPGGLWVRGQGLDVEASGDIQAAYRSATVLTGTLRIVRGRFDYLGRAFTLRKGSLVFYGRDPPDPVMEIVAEAKVGDVAFTITLGGTLSEPSIQMDSQPQMPEADMVSYLLLGRPVDRLNTGQLDLVRERLTEIASLRGAGELQAAVSTALGLDVLKIGEGSAGSDEVLLIGKYLSPRLLLGYERGLAGGSPTYVTLEYLISEFFRLKTWTGQGGDSSVEISFVKDY